MNEEATVVKAAIFLKQLQEEAIKSIKYEIIPKDNLFNVEGFFYVDGRMMGTEKSKYHIKAKLNGKEYVIEGEVEAKDIHFYKKEVVTMVLEAISNSISRIVYDGIKESFELNPYVSK